MASSVSGQVKIVDDTELRIVGPAQPLERGPVRGDVRTL
jgi:hypothetical protein